MAAATGSSVTSRIVDAVTALLNHGGEIFMVRRHPNMAVFPGFHAFPGGKVDKCDADSALAHPVLAAHPPRLMHALHRELLEELGFDLFGACAAGKVRRITDLGVALTPPVQPLRFNTHFYRVDLTERPALNIDRQESISEIWGTPAALWQRYQRGQLLLAPPTIATLRALSADPDCSSIPELDFGLREHAELPMVEPQAGVRMIFVRSNTLPPATHTNVFLLGDAQSHRILVDPSPSSREELEKLKALCQRLVIHEVFLTHHHPDHREHADDIARHFNAPLGLSQDTYDRIKAKCGMQFFEGLTINTYREGDVVCRWQGQPVRVYEVPGHDEGQLALMPDGRAWCIVSDLIQGIGTVVVARPEGNMRRYFASLQRMIDLNPEVIYPSHGGALGTVHRLQETLKHRQLREQQVLTLHREGRSVAEMLPLIYKDLPDPRLLPLAQMNIESHLEKLREDGQIPA
jgi:endoribonuclease LACTB2